MLMVKVPSAKVTAVEITNLLHKRFTLEQLNLFTSLKGGEGMRDTLSKSRKAE